MEEVRREEDDIGVRLNWPADTLSEQPLPRRVDDVDSASVSALTAVAGAPSAPRATLDDLIAEVRDLRRVQAAALTDARTNAIESAAAFRKLATTTVQMSSELSGALNAIRDVASKQASLSDEVGALRVELARVIDEVGAIRRRLAVSARGSERPLRSREADPGAEPATPTRRRRS